MNIIKLLEEHLKILTEENQPTYEAALNAGIKELEVLITLQAAIVGREQVLRFEISSLQQKLGINAPIPSAMKIDRRTLRGKRAAAELERIKEAKP